MGNHASVKGKRGAEVARAASIERVGGVRIARRGKIQNNSMEVLFELEKPKQSEKTTFHFVNTRLGGRKSEEVSMSQDSTRPEKKGSK